MKERHFFYFLYGIMGIIALTVPVVNYAIDYYGVFRWSEREFIESNEINDRFVKIEYLLRNRNFEKYDSYLWGSSRVQKTDTKLTGKRTYNMGAPAGMPEDCLRDLKQLQKHGVFIDTVYLGLDDLSYLTDGKALVFMIYRQPYEQEIDKRYKYYANLLADPGIVKIWGQEKVKHSPKAKTLLYQNGMYLVPWEIESHIEKNPGEYVQEKNLRNLRNLHL